MDYKELIGGLRVISKYEKRREYNEINVGNVMEQAASAIIDLLARAEAAEARCARLEEARENANEAADKWEGMYHMALERAEKAEFELKRYVGGANY